jgi:type I restriction enzyme R subunit
MGCRRLALRARTQAIARHLTDFLKKSNRFDTTIVFCVDQEHASEMREALVNLNADLVAQFPDYVARVTADEGSIGRGHLSSFQDLEKKTPVILTSSQLLTTGVDAPTCKNVVLARVIGSMSEFKQIIGRGTRLRDDYGKLWFNILDYTGAATRLFADKDFDGEPTRIIEEQITPAGETTATMETTPQEQEPPPQEPEGGYRVAEPPPIEPRKFYFDGGQVEVVAHLVHELDPNGKQLRVVKYTDYAAESVRSLAPNSADLRRRWADAEKRNEIITTLNERGVDFAELAEQTGQADADPFDLLCHLAFNAPLRTRRERAQRLKSEQQDYFEKFSPEARQVLDELLEKYAEHGDAQFVLPDVLRVPPISTHGQPAEIIKLFGGPDQLRQAVIDLQGLLYGSN